LFDLAVWLPGLVFIGLAVWLLRKVIKAARTEGAFEEERLRSALGDTLADDARRVSPDFVPPAADHRALVERLVEEREQQIRLQHVGPADVKKRVELLWVHSTPSHAVWCERRHAATAAASAMTRDVICVAQIEKGQVVERWFFG